MPNKIGANKSEDDSNVSKETSEDEKAEKSGDTSEKTEEPRIGGGYTCDAACMRMDNPDHCDGMILCRYCNLGFCQDCYHFILLDKFPPKICGRTHSFMTIPYLQPEQVFNFGEVLVNGKATPVEQWKADPRRQ